MSFGWTTGPLLAGVSSDLVVMLFESVVPDSGSSEGLPGVGWEEVVRSSRIWVDVWGLLNAT